MKKRASKTHTPKINCKNLFNRKVPFIEEKKVLNRETNNK